MSHNNEAAHITSSLSSVTHLDDYIFDPFDGTFVKINMNNTECSGTLSEQGKRDCWTLVIALSILCLFLLVLLYASCN